MDQILRPPVPEGTSHELAFTFAEADPASSPLQAAAISSIRLWLDDALTGATINGRQDHEVKNTSIGTLADVVEAGVTKARLTVALGAADAVIVGTGAAGVDERHRVTLKVTYTRTGGGSAQLTHRAYYDVTSLERI
jgi:hypothetical protein